MRCHDNDNLARSLRCDAVVEQTPGEMVRSVGVLLLLLACAAAQTPSESGGGVLPQATRATSVRGWNSYNGWGGAVNETVLLAVADFMQARAPRRAATPPL